MRELRPGDNIVYLFDRDRMTQADLDKIIGVAALERQKIIEATDGLLPHQKAEHLRKADAALDLARAEAKERGQSNISFVTSDVHALYFPDDTFDVVHAHQVLQHVGDPVQALRELRRVCAPGGVVAARGQADTLAGRGQMGSGRLTCGSVSAAGALKCNR